MSRLDNQLGVILQSMPWMAVESMPAALQSFFVINHEAKTGSSQSHRLFFYKHQLMEGSDRSVFEAAKCGEDTLCFFVDCYIGLGHLICDFAILPLSQLSILPSKKRSGGMVCEVLDADHNSPSKPGSKQLAMARIAVMTNPASPLYGVDIISVGIHPDLHGHGVMRFLLTNLLQAIYDGYGDLPARADCVHLATALYFALDDTERVLVLSKPHEGGALDGSMEQAKSLLDLLRYHKARLGVVPRPVVSVSALTASILMPSSTTAPVLQATRQVADSAAAGACSVRGHMV
ncbi:MAG: hypothetical protein P1U40_03465 [Coxiellaceae bacterium]|nr:hypothetical protein [Coxiellaceae bacterium]